MWRQFAKRQQRIEKKYVPMVSKAIAKELKPIVNHLKTHGNNGIHSVVANSIHAKDLYVIIEKMYYEAALGEANKTFKELKKKHLKLRGFGFNKEWQSIINTYLSNTRLLDTCQNISSTTKERILKIIADGIRDGKSYDMIAQEITSDEIPYKRALLIVRTESVGAMNIGSMMGAISTGIKYQKKWITANDHRVRGNKPKDQFSHVVLGGDMVDMEKTFNNGERLRYPGDKSASAGNFCNCRCTMAFIAKRDSNGRIMRYPTPVSNNPKPSNVLAEGLTQFILGAILGEEINNTLDGIL